MRLLLAVDIHHQGPERLVNEAVLWAQRLDAQVDLAFAGMGAWSLGAASDPDIKALIDREASRTRASEQERLEALLETIPTDHRGTATVLDGPPVAALVEASKDHAALLMGTHGRTGVSRFWLGSVSEQLVRKAECPVLVLKLYRAH